MRFSLQPSHPPSHVDGPTFATPAAARATESCLLRTSSTTTTSAHYTSTPLSSVDSGLGLDSDSMGTLRQSPPSSPASPNENATMDMVTTGSSLDAGEVVQGQREEGEERAEVGAHEEDMGNGEGQEGRAEVDAHEEDIGKGEGEGQEVRVEVGAHEEDIGNGEGEGQEGCAEVSEHEEDKGNGEGAQQLAEGPATGSSTMFSPLREVYVALIKSQGRSEWIYVIERY